MSNWMGFLRKICLLVLTLVCGTVLLSAGAGASGSGDNEVDASIRVQVYEVSSPGDGEGYKLGDTITFSIQIFNTGNVEISNITLKEDLTGLEFNVGTLKLAEVSESIEVTYMVTEADILAEGVTLKATATGSDPYNNTVTNTDECQAPTEKMNSHISLSQKVVSELSCGKACKVGDEIAFDIIATNDGNITMLGIHIQDERTKESWDIEKLLPGQSWSTRVTYTVTEEDADEGSVAGIPVVRVVTLTANSGTFTYDGNKKSVSGYTCDVEGLTFNEVVTAKAEETDAGTYAVTFSGVTLNVTTDTTGRYVVSEIKEGTLTINNAPAPEMKDIWKPVAKTGLIENGTAKELIVAPKAVPDGYTIEYSIDGKTWSDGIPEGTKSGTYTVQVRYQPDKNHTGFAGEALTVKIQGVYDPPEAISEWTQGSNEKLSLRIKKRYNDEDCFPNFAAVSVDGETCQEGADYSVEQGSVIISFAPEYLELLDKGEHAVKVSFTDGEAETKILVVEKEETTEQTGEGTEGTGAGTGTEGTEGAGTAEGTTGPATGDTGTEGTAAAEGTTGLVTDASPSTGDSSRLMLWAVLAILASAGFGTAVWLKRRNTAV